MLFFLLAEYSLQGRDTQRVVIAEPNLVYDMYNCEVKPSTNNQLFDCTTLVFIFNMVIIVQIHILKLKHYRKTTKEEIVNKSLENY